LTNFTFTHSGGKGDIAITALVFRVFGFAKVKIAKVQLQILVEADNGRDLSE
jgi:hypothetical protein